MRVGGWDGGSNRSKMSKYIIIVDRYWGRNIDCKIIPFTTESIVGAMIRQAEGWSKPFHFL